MLGGLVHRPAQRLATQLAQRLPGELNHVFFSDSGSIGVEVAIKIAVQFFRNKGINRHRIAYLKGAYHGDTFGTMAVCDPEEGMHRLFQGILPDHVMLPRPPKCGANQPEIVDYFRTVRSILDVSLVAAILLEPLMQGAGGFFLYDLEILQNYRAICDDLGILLIFDEVATGFGRLGELFVADLGIVPDVIVLGKGLTGGHIGQAATVATSAVYAAFLSDDASHALMHGPTFMANPVACCAALASLALCLNPDYLPKIRDIERRLMGLYRLRNAPGVVDVRVKGAMAVVEVDHPNRLEGFQAYAVSLGVWLRPFGRYAYTTPPSVIRPEELAKVMSVFDGWFLP